MATVSNVNLTIQKGGDGSRRRVKVTYRICFSSCEVLAGSVFVEQVKLRGDDPIWDDHLTTLRSRCVKAEKGCVDREIIASVSRSTLDEDGDTVIFGIPIFADRDEIYARVSVTPFSPSGSTADSNIVTGQFGAAGND
ncbi:MAG: hypothetical protein OEX02_08510 [Cyclobacteriaceae bacterium]|nr:hypothetical protein [Cyclobacteriaceae bacterium]